MEWPGLSVSPLCCEASVQLEKLVWGQELRIRDGDIWTLVLHLLLALLRGLRRAGWPLSAPVHSCANWVLSAQCFPGVPPGPQMTSHKPSSMPVQEPSEGRRVGKLCGIIQHHLGFTGWGS